MHIHICKLYLYLCIPLYLLINQSIYISVFFQSIPPAYVYDKAHLLSLTVKTPHDRSSDTFPGSPPTSSCLLVSDYPLQTLSPRKCFLTGNHARTIRALGFSSAFFIFFLPQILFLRFPSYIYSYLSPFQTPRPGLDTPPLYNCPNHLLVHTPINKDSVCLSSVSTTPNIALLQHLQCQVLTIHLPICSSD